VTLYCPAIGWCLRRSLDAALGTSATACLLWEIRTSAAASRASSALDPVSAARAAGWSGSPTCAAPSRTRLSRYGATSGHTAWTSRRKMSAPAGCWPHAAAPRTWACAHARHACCCPLAAPRCGPGRASPGTASAKPDGPVGRLPTRPVARPGAGRPSGPDVRTGDRRDRYFLSPGTTAERRAVGFVPRPACFCRGWFHSCRRPATRGDVRLHPARHYLLAADHGRFGCENGTCAARPGSRW
jgi:hypothetical protein